MQAKVAVIGAAVLIAGLFVAASNALAASAQAQASAVVVQPFSISNQAGLSFGHLYAGDSAGSVVMAVDGSRSASGGVAFAPSSEGSAAGFMVSGMPDASFSISLPQSAVLEAEGGHQMVVSDFISEPAASGKLDGAGEQALSVGAALQVQAGQAVGAYAGSFEVVVEYN